MGRHLTTDIKIENSRTKKYRNILHTIVTDRIKNIENVGTDEDGKLLYYITSTLQGGKIKQYKNGELYIALFNYQIKDDDGNMWFRKSYITYDEYLTYQRNENINNTLNLPSEIIDGFPKSKIPFEVKVGDKLFSKSYYGKRKEIIVEKVTPRTFIYSILKNDDNIKYRSRIKKSNNGSSIWGNNVGDEICK